MIHFIMSTISAALHRKLCEYMWEYISKWSLSPHRGVSISHAIVHFEYYFCLPIISLHHFSGTFHISISLICFKNQKDVPLKKHAQIQHPYEGYVSTSLQSSL